MIVVSDTSPIRYLVLIGAIDVLPAIFQTVVVPPVVASELQRPRTPAPVRQFIQEPPAWLRIEAPVSSDAMLDVDSSEKDAILLAMERQATLLIDDNRGRKAAVAR